MDGNGLTKLEQEIRRLRRECRTQRVVSFGCVLAIAILLDLYIAKPSLVLASTTDGKSNLHVRGLIVEDQSGHERIRLGAPIPDSMIYGVRYNRHGAISGLSISDSDGNERGGIVTSDKDGEAFLALDSQDQQQVPSPAR